MIFLGMRSAEFFRSARRAARAWSNFLRLAEDGGDVISSCDVNSTSLKCLDQRLKLRSKRFVVWRYGRDLAVDTKQLIGGHLSRSHRILHCKDAIIGNFDEPADERQISP